LKTILLFLFVSRVLFAVGPCTSTGGVCTACGAKAICIGGVNDQKLFNPGCTTLLGDACVTQATVSCICGGCDYVKILSGNGTCKNDSGCSSPCSPPTPTPTPTPIPTATPTPTPTSVPTPTPTPTPNPKFFVGPHNVSKVSQAKNLQGAYIWHIGTKPTPTPSPTPGPACGACSSDSDCPKTNGCETCPSAFICVSCASILNEITCNARANCTWNGTNCVLK